MKSSDHDPKMDVMDGEMAAAFAVAAMRHSDCHTAIICPVSRALAVLGILDIGLQYAFSIHGDSEATRTAVSEALQWMDQMMTNLGLHDAALEPFLRESPSLKAAGKSLDASRLAKVFSKPTGGMS